MVGFWVNIGLLGCYATTDSRVNPLKTYDNLALNFFSFLEFLLDVIIYS